MRNSKRSNQAEMKEPHKAQLWAKAGVIVVAPGGNLALGLNVSLRDGSFPRLMGMVLLDV